MIWACTTARFAYAGEVALGAILSDPSGELRTLKEAASIYPEALSRALVDGMWKAEFALQNAAKAVGRLAVSCVAGCVFRVVLISAHALLGRAAKWVVNEKEAVRSAGLLPNAPIEFAARCGQLLGRIGETTSELRDTLAAAEELVAETNHACGR